MNGKGIIKKVSKILGAMVMLMGFSAMAHADWSNYLTVVGEGTILGSSGSSYQLIYDRVQDITWLDYTNIGEGGPAPVVEHSWENQVAWAQNLNIVYNNQNITGWRLPTTVDGPFVRETKTHSLAQKDTKT